MLRIPPVPRPHAPAYSLHLAALVSLLVSSTSGVVSSWALVVGFPLPVLPSPHSQSSLFSRSPLQPPSSESASSFFRACPSLTRDVVYLLVCLFPCDMAASPQVATLLFPLCVAPAPGTRGGIQTRLLKYCVCWNEWNGN